MAKKYVTGEGGLGRKLTPTEVDDNFRDAHAREQAAIDAAANAVTLTWSAANQAAMFALNNAKKGHECKRTDEKKLYRMVGTDPSVLENWLFIAIYSIEPDINNTLTSEATDKALAAAQGKVLKDLVDSKLGVEEKAADSDKLDGKNYATLAALWGADIATAIAALVGGAPATLDTINEIATALENNPAVIDALNTAIAAKVAIADINDTLTSLETNKPLSAAQGKVLKDLLDALTTVVGNKQAAIISGVATIANGDTEVTVGAGTVVSTSHIFLTQKNGSPAIGQLVSKSIIDNTSFVIKCEVAAEADTDICWMIL